jgi:hypothetical protein
MATLTASGGINYKWNTGATVPQIHVSPIEGQTYSVESTSKNGCLVAIDSVTLHKIQTLPVAISGDQLLCDGDTSILSVDQSLNNVYWNTGDYSNAITINPDQTTIYNVIAIDSITGCVGTDSAIVTVNHGANGNGALCYYYINTCNPYYYIVVQGNNSNSITWSDGQIGDEITTTSATAISSVTYSNNNGCSDYTEQVSIDTSINAQSVIFVGDTLVCQGATVRVLTGTNGFPITGYLWSTGSTNYYTDVTVLGDTTISAIVYLDSCFKTGSFTIHTLKDTIAPIWAPDSLCINNTGTNLYTIQGGQSYLWSSGSTSFYSPLYGSQVANQTYNLTITYKGGCTRKGSKTVHFFQPETFNIIGDSIVCPGDTIELIADNPNFNYTWYSSNGTHYQNDTLLVHPETTESFSIYAGYANPTKTCMLNKNFTVSINQNHDIKINGSDIACNGDSIIFTSSDSQYDLLWQDGSTNDTLIVFPNNNDIISLQGTSACGTVSYDSILVNVVSGSLSLNYDITICQTNQPIIISTMHQGNYLWYNGSNDSSISLLASTDTTIFVDITLPSGCNIREYHNIHFFQESILSYPSTVAICEGASTTLRVLGSNNIIWSNGFTSPVILVSPLSSTWYSFTSTSLNGCIRHDSIYVQVLSKPNLTLTGQNFCCSGSYVNFYSNISPTLANQTYSYLWSNGITTRDCITQISTPQNISLTVTSSNGCSSTATKFIQTDYYPVAISGATKICKYSSTTLSINPLDYPSGSLFSWNTGDSTSSITVSPTSTHSYTVFIKLANACVISKSIIVEVSTTPQIYASSNSPCIGDTVIIKSTNPYNTYNWSNSSTDATISTSSSGTYSLICTNDIGCTDTSNVINILFNQPTPIIASLTMDSICYGTNSILNLSGAGLFVISPTIYSTQVNNQQFILNPESTTQYHIQAITQTSCNSSIDIPLYVHPLPIVNAGSDTTVLTGSSIILGGSPSANGIGPFSYLWQPGYILNDSTISNPVALPNTNTSLVLFVTDFHGCNNNDTIHLQVTNSTGISQLNESGEIKYYPNPTKGIISIEGFSLKHEAFQLVVYNSLGQHIYSNNIKDEDISNGAYSFDLSSFKDGFYTLQLKSQSSLHHFKIIKSNN